MPNLFDADSFRRYLEALPQVNSVGEIEIEKKIVRNITIDTEQIGEIEARQLDAGDAPALYDFYFNGLSERSKQLFIPYPLFHTLPSSPEELASRITGWQKEDDWSAIVVVQKNRIVGIGILKRFYTEHVTSAVAIRDDFFKLGLGYLLQMIVIGQAKLLNLKMFHVKIISDNIASLRLHEKCGFRETGVVPWDGYEELREFLDKNDYEGKNNTAERRILEMVIDLNDE